METAPCDTPLLQNATNLDMDSDTEGFLPTIACDVRSQVLHVAAR